MATLIKSTNQLRKIFETKAQQAIMLSQAEIYEVIQKHMEDYYNEAVFKNGSTEPSFYSRTYRLLNSLIQTNIITENSFVSCSVQIDDNYLKYQYKGNSSWDDNVSAIGADVVGWANEGLHGGTVGGGKPFWDNAIQELGGKSGIMKIIEKNFKKVGLPITKWNNNFKRLNI